MKQLLSYMGAACVLASSFAATAATTTLGYADPTLSRNNGFRLGDETTQGMAMRLDARKIALLKGAAISGLQAAVASARTTDSQLTIFLTTDLDAEPLRQTTVDIGRAANWEDYLFDSPYIIAGDEPALYIGYKAEISTASSMLLSDKIATLPGLTFAFDGSEWADVNSMGRGAGTLRALVDDAPDFADLMLMPVSTDGYFKAENLYGLSGRVFNFGTKEVSSFSLGAKVGADVSSTDYADANVAPGESMNFVIEGVRAANPGAIDVTVDVAGFDDADTADNAFQSPMFFYPAEMQRSMLIECFTGQTCGNCPAGHRTVASFLENDGIDIPVIEIMHHAGYYPDIFTMADDVEYTFFYGSGNTFAPAFMMNRAAIPGLDSQPVMNTTANNLAETYNYLSNRQPYAALSLETEYDEASRVLKVNLKGTTLNDFPTDKTLFNVAIVQDGFIADQSGAGSYYHNCVFRGTLTNNTWGVLVPDDSAKAGGSFSWTTEYTLPEAIVSSYWTAIGTAEDQLDSVTLPTDPANMRVIAYVGAYDADDFNGHEVYNSIEVPWGESKTQGGFGVTSVDTLAARPNVAVRVAGGSIIVEGEHDRFEVYDLQGRLRRSDGLAPGFYIVKVDADGLSIVRKVMVK